MAQKKNSKSKKKNANLFATAVVVLGLLVILVLFLAKKDQIVSNLKETDFFNKVIGSTPEFVENHEVKETEKKTIPLKNEEITINVEPVKPVEKPSEKQPEKIVEKQEEKPVETKAEEKKETKKETPEPKKEEPKVQTTDLNICFVEIDSDGSVVRKIVKRNVKKNDSPLGTALGILLAGPDSTRSAERNCMTLIPEGTKLLSARVKDGVAYLNFNEAFEINTYGVEGYIGQLMQVVYTATEFSTVNSVQFMIEGEKRDYLGSEGQWIGSPLSRNSF